MSYAGTAVDVSVDLHTFIQAKEERIAELKLRLREEITINEEMELLKTLSQEMRDLYNLKEKSLFCSH